MNRSILHLLIVVFLLITATPALGQSLPSIASKTEGMEKLDGFFPLYWDDAGGKVWIEVGRWDTDFLYLTSLSAGLGSNDIGLDRGLLGAERVVQFHRAGPKVLLMAPNQNYRATSDNPAERKAVADAFAQSVVWGFKAEAATGDRVLVDATSFMLRDVMGVARRLQGQGEGNFRVDAQRSAPYKSMTRAFPENTEMEALLTFVGDNPGGQVRSVASDPTALTVRMRQSFIMLPELGSYTPRKFDPRSGAGALGYVDYATPISSEKEQRYLVRHRLEKADPNAAVSEAVEPIVYYLDPGTPEPIRSALLDGARWWADAFEAAGFSNAYRVEVLPDDADMLDVRYNVIQWVHRSTRGWSYGRSVRDPRTGEILKGHVSLGSLRVRQDYLLAEGLLSPYANDEEREDDPMLEMALARLRQLSAHEVGHTLGFMHNFASSVNNRASVMDYPAPMTEWSETDGISLANAYDTGIGEWDIVSVKYSYSVFPDSVDEAVALEDILTQANDSGLQFISDTDARPQGGAHPAAHLWDNGADPVANLMKDMSVRRHALDRFGLSTIQFGRPLAQMEEALVPLYLHHRYQVEAVVKLIAGVDYSYTIRGDARRLPEAVPGSRQREALTALLGTVTPEALQLPTHLRTQIPPRPPGYGPHRELFGGHTGLTFDPYAPASVATSMVFDLIVNPQRAARLIYQNDFDSRLPSLNDVMDQVFEHVWQQSSSSAPYTAELQRLIQQVWTDAVMHLAANRNAAPAVQARAVYHLRKTMRWLEGAPGRDPETIAHRDQVYDTIDRFLGREYDQAMPPRELTMPPGSPIGHEAEDHLRLLDAWVPAGEYCQHGW